MNLNFGQDLTKTTLKMAGLISNKNRGSSTMTFTIAFCRIKDRFILYNFDDWQKWPTFKWPMVKGLG